MTADECIQIMTRRIVERFSPLKVLLFGSRARGDHRPDSDIDLIVVFSAIEHDRQLAVEIRKAVSGLVFAKDILVATPDEIKQSSALLDHVLHRAIPESRVLYDAAG